MLVNMPEFKEYIRIEDMTENMEDSIDIYSIIHNTNEFKQSSIEIAQVLNCAFDFVENYSKSLMPFIQIYNSNSAIEWSKVG